MSRKRTGERTRRDLAWLGDRSRARERLCKLCSSARRTPASYASTTVLPSLCLPCDWSFVARGSAPRHSPSTRNARLRMRLFAPPLRSRRERVPVMRSPDDSRRRFVRVRLSEVIHRPGYRNRYSFHEFDCPRHAVVVYVGFALGVKSRTFDSHTSQVGRCHA